MNREKVLDRVQKLLALASNVLINENEALVANTKAQELITKWQIEEAELNQVNKKEIEIVFVRIDTQNKSDILWKNRLVCYLTEVNNCKFIISKRTREQTLSDILKKKAKETREYRCTIYTVFGTKSNVELVQVLYDLISNQTIQLCS